MPEPDRGCQKTGFRFFLSPSLGEASFQMNVFRARRTGLT
jgi:hypothetical protein